MSAISVVRPRTFSCLCTRIEKQNEDSLVVALLYIVRRDYVPAKMPIVLLTFPIRSTYLSVLRILYVELRDAYGSV